jgi:hypothetical protein
VGLAAATVVAIVISGTAAGAKPAPTTPYVRVSEFAFGIESHGGRVPALVPITLSGPAAAPVTLHYATENLDGDTATPKVDYKPVSGTITIPPGTVQSAVHVPVLPDHMQDPQETFHVVISDVVGAVLLGSVAKVEIDDTYTTAGMLGSTTVYDSESMGRGKTYIAKVTFTLIDRFDHDVNAEYITTPNSATADVDYVFKRGTFTIPAGKLSASVTVKLIKRPAVSGRGFYVRAFPIAGLFDSNAEVNATIGLLPPAGS